MTDKNEFWIDMAVPSYWDKNDLDWPDVIQEVTPALTKFIHNNPHVRMAYFKGWELLDSLTVDDEAGLFEANQPIIRLKFSARWTQEYNDELWRQKAEAEGLA